MEQDKTYWNNKGKYEKVNDFVWMFIPLTGEVKGYAQEVNKALESVRILNRFYYDIYNNGGCNLCGYESSDSYVTEWYHDYENQLEYLLSFTFGYLDYYKLRGIKNSLKSEIINGSLDYKKLERFTDYVMLKAFRTIKTHLTK